MRTRLVRVRRRPRGIYWAAVFLALSMAFYIRVSLPAPGALQGEGAQADERVTEEVRVEPVEMYLVSFGGYDVMNAAKVEAARYVSRGAAGYVLSRERLYVIGAGYPRREEAEQACIYLAAKEGMACAVLEVFSGGPVMRMTAGRGQIDAFTGAERALRKAAELAGGLAFSLDRGEAGLSQALQVIETELASVENARKKLKNACRGTQNEVFLGMLSLLEEMERQMEVLLRAEKAMALSSGLKYCSIDITVREAEMMNALMR